MIYDGQSVWQMSEMSVLSGLYSFLKYSDIRTFKVGSHQQTNVINYFVSFKKSIIKDSYRDELSRNVFCQPSESTSLCLGPQPSSKTELCL